MNDDIETFYPWLRKVAQSMVGPKEAEDVAQEGWLEAWRSLDRHDPERSPKAFWMKHRAYSRMLDVRRKMNRRREDPAEIDLEAITFNHYDLHSRYHNSEIWRAIKTLTPREKEYVFLRFWGGYKVPEMRQHFGYEPSRLWTLAKKKLGGKLEHLREAGDV